MRFLRAMVVLLVAALLAGFDLPPRLASLVDRAAKLDGQIKLLESQRTKLESRLEALAARIDRAKEGSTSPLGRARLERLLAQASEVSDSLEALELKLQDVRRQREAIGLRIADECERGMAEQSRLVKSATTKEEAKRALEAYIAYRNLRDRWAPRKEAGAQEFLIPHPLPTDTVSELERKRDMVEDLLTTLDQLRGELQKRLQALERERELEREIRERAELRRLFEEGEIETFGTSPPLTDADKIADEIRKLGDWLDHLARVRSELVSARSEIEARLKEMRGGAGR